MKPAHSSRMLKRETEAGDGAAKDLRYVLDTVLLPHTSYKAVVWCFKHHGGSDNLSKTIGRIS